MGIRPAITPRPDYDGSMSDHAAVKLGVAGLGGYARSIIDLILNEGPTTDPIAELAAVCDPDLTRHGELVETLKNRGVGVYETYEQMLGHAGLEAVWLPVPIDLHVPFAKSALAAGLAVMIEKPVAGTIDELDELIAARDAAGRPVLVGFQDVYDAGTLPLKRRLLSGELGQVQRATVHGCWPRDTTYFGRATWAGAIKRGETWVLDSPVNNAMAHYVNIVLFLLGQNEPQSATPTHLTAELYRAAKIENYDTASIRVGLDRGAGGVDFLIHLTHACEQQVGPIIDIHTDRGNARWTPTELSVTIDGQTQTQTRDGRMRPRMLECFAKVVRGRDHPQHSAATLEVARAHALIVNGASQAAPVVPISDDDVDPLTRDSATIFRIPDIEAVFAQCADDDQMLHESGRLPFTQPPGTLDLKSYNHFAGIPAADPV